MTIKSNARLTFNVQCISHFTSKHEDSNCLTLVRTRLITVTFGQVNKYRLILINTQCWSWLMHLCWKLDHLSYT